MRNALTLLFSAVLPQLLAAQTASQNYILSRRPLDASGKTAIETVTYIDGLGRPVETVQKCAAPDGGDIVSIKEYDGLDREVRSWLPVSMGTGGGYVSPQAFKQSAVGSDVYGGDAFPYSENVYDQSALGRIVRQHGPGKAWRDAGSHTDTEFYANRVNDDTLACLDYRVGDNGLLVCRGECPAGSLYVTKTTDEDGGVSYEFTDMFGDCQLVRRILDGHSLDTYYVRDGLHQVCYVLPPAASSELTATGASWNIADNETLRNYAYYYRRDGLGRILEKKFPGAEPILYVNDRSGNPVFSQNGVQRQSSEWSFQLYDCQNRPTVSGRIVTASAPSKPQTITSSFTGSGSLGGYAPYAGFPQAKSVTADLVYYYDSYAFLDRLSAAERAALTYTTVSRPYQDAYRPDGSFRVRGQRTGEVVYSLDGGGKHRSTAFYYDVCYRVVQSRTLDATGNSDCEYTSYSFTDKPLLRRHVYTSSNETIDEVYAYSYDSMDRLTDTRLSLNGGESRLLSSVSYDAIGRPCKTTLGNGTTVSSSYNVRSWLKTISSPFFSEALGYESPGTVAAPRYGGSISRIDWRATDGKQTLNQTFANRYDGLDRLVNVDYTRNGTSYNRFAAYTYDSMGNIRSLQRKGRLDGGAIGLVDDLKYEYDGNHRIKVTDWAGRSVTAKDAMHFIDGSDADVEYEYDANGNMTRDLNRNITGIRYNSIDLPSQIVFMGKNPMHIKHTYLADGTRIRTDHISSSGNLRLNAYTEYRSNHVYENGRLSMTLFDGGFVSYTNGDVSNPSFHYYIKDHLGSNHVVLADNGTVEQVNDYYPFGALMSNGWTNASAQKYKYIGKELDRTFGYDMYDNGARWNNSVLGRWETMDKFAEKNYGGSPYAVCNDNPFKYIDDDGNRIKTVQYCNVENVPRSYYHSPKAFGNAMKIFGQTSYGQKILSDFTPIGSKFFGVNGNGKYSDFNFSIQEESFTYAEARTSRFGGYEQIKAQTHMREGENGKPEFTIVFDLSYDEAEYIESIVHEFSIHMAKYADVLEEFNRTGSYEAALKVWQKTSGSEEHSDAAPDGEQKLKGTRIYYETKREVKTLVNGLKK